MEKIQPLYEPLIVGITLNTSLVINHFKAYFLKNALENINQEVKRGNLN